MAIDIVANHQRLAKQSVALIEPCYDSLADTFKRHDVPLERFPDAWLTRPDLAELLGDLVARTIFLVLPNNPTGSLMTEDQFTTLLRHCQRSGTLLVLDCCFRFYVNARDRFDAYALMVDADIDYMVIEATGKTWPTSELKASFICTSPRVARAVYDIHTDLLLNASPFVVRLLTEFVRLSLDDSLASVTEPVERNRATLRSAIANTQLIPIEVPNLPFSWLRTAPATSATVTRALAERGVYVLPGEFFFWADHEAGRHFVRVALARDPAVFAAASDILEGVCVDIAPRLQRAAPAASSPAQST